MILILILLEEEKAIKGEGKIKIHVIAAKNLADTSGLLDNTDPFVIVSNTFNNQKFKTSTQKSTQSPNWDQEFVFQTPLPLRGELKFTILDRISKSKENFMGVLTLPCVNLKPDEPFDDWIELTAEAKKSKKKPPGQIRLKIELEEIETKQNHWRSEISGFVEVHKKKRRRKRKKRRSRSSRRSKSQKRKSRHSDEEK